MSALTSARNTKEIYCNATTLHRVCSPAQNSSPQPGGICALDSNAKAVPASDSADLVVIGRCEEILPDGRVIAKTGVFLYENGTGTEKLELTDVNKIVYALDDQTVGKIGGNHRIAAGILRDVTASGEVAVEIGTQQIASV